MKKRGRGAPKGSQNAIKLPGKPATCSVAVRCRPEQKEQWMKKARAKGMTLSSWVCESLDRC
jgi:predicted HicB family RNase H-like nuclease